MVKSSTKGKGMPAPDPIGAWDASVIEGPNWPEICQLLDENTEIAEKDWAFQQVLERRNKNWVRLRELGVTVGRIVRTYAVDKGKGVGEPIISHVGVIGITKRMGFVPLDERPTTESTEQENTA
jgi:hypothetical protein